MNDTPTIPCAPMAEKAVLSLVIQDPLTWCPRIESDGLQAAHFHFHGAFWEIISRRRRSGKSLDMVSLVQEEIAAGTLDAVGGATGVSEIYTYTPDGRYYTHHLRILRESLARRRAYLAALKMAEITDDDDPEEIREAFSAAVDGITSALSVPRGMVTAKEACGAFFDRFQSDFENGDLPGLATGILEIDRICGGMRPGEVWIIGAETSGGKSVLMHQIAVNVLNAGGRVAEFNLELGAPEIIARMLCYHGGIHYGKITQPRTAGKYDLQSIQRNIEAMSAWNLWIDDRPKLTGSRIEGAATQLRDREGKIDLIIVDYLQLVGGERGRNESRQEEVSRISKTLKNLAREMKCPVVTASQLNDDGRIREARDPAHDADAVLMIGADGIKVAKMRNAERNQILPLILNGALQRFEFNDNPPQEESNQEKKSRWKK